MSNTAISPWQPAPREWSLGNGDVIVFRVSLLGTPASGDQSLLSADERARALRFRFDLHRDRWVQCRAALRRLLGLVIDTPPGDVPIVYSARGKPRVPDIDLRFNVSHSHDLALISLARGVELGIDVELLCDSPDLPSVAQHFFTPAEQYHLAAGPPELFTTRFYQVWTRKEALMKFLGDGFLEPPKNLDVSPTFTSPDSTLPLPPNTPASACHILELRPTPTSIGALVTEPRIANLRLYIHSTLTLPPHQFDPSTPPP